MPVQKLPLPEIRRPAAAHSDKALLPCCCAALEDDYTALARHAGRAARRACSVRARACRAGGTQPGQQDAPRYRQLAGGPITASLHARQAAGLPIRVDSIASQPGTLSAEASGAAQLGHGSAGHRSLSHLQWRDRGLQESSRPGDTSNASAAAGAPGAAALYETGQYG